jgi:DNA helicase IV
VQGRLQQELEAEQAVVDVLYARLDGLRVQTRERLRAVRRTGPSGSPQNRSERDAFATLYEDRLAQLEAVEDRLAFGRLDLVDDSAHYIGRIGLNDENHTSLLTDWRAPAAQAFYRATAAHPDGVRRRRHLVSRRRTVTGVEDEVLDLSLLVDDSGAQTPGAGAVLAGLSGEGALLAALAAGRTGHMGDIVATIQAEQDAIIRSELAGTLVVQGGPGTGKTAVALHRAAYLLYAHRRLLERSGVLLIGPSRTFLHYIDQVLPSLGETGVVTTTIADLFPGVSARGEEDPATTALKGRLTMARVIERAVRQRQRVPQHETAVRVDGRTIVISPTDIQAAMNRTRRHPRPHNLARVTFVREMLHRLAEQYVGQLGYPIAPEERGEIIEELRTTREIRIALNLAWMPLTPEKLVDDLLSRPHRLEAAAPELRPEERALLLRAPGSPWTESDVPLLDEAAELLGEDDQASRALAHADAERRAGELEYARQVLESTGGNGIVSAEVLADRFTSTGPVLTTAERAAADRSWTYGHVVVDEAQELSAMAWRMLLRRVPTRSMTVVGDVAQTSSSAGARSWRASLDPVLRQSWRLAELTVNYRTPAVIADAAQRMARAANLPVSTVTSARTTPDSLVIDRLEPGPTIGAALPDAVVRHVRAALESVADGTGAGRVAVIGTPPDLEVVQSAVDADAWLSSLTRASQGGRGVDLDAAVTLLTPRQSKGLEFDVVVLVEPAHVLEVGAGDLYVAMTRPTRQLRVVHRAPLPDGFADQT